tara:strand:+ start:553 stop:780 length:228 start_codon:yes stop_codon:yes gene_type:complete
MFLVSVINTQTCFAMAGLIQEPLKLLTVWPTRGQPLFFFDALVGCARQILRGNDVLVDGLDLFLEDNDRCFGVDE